MFSSFKTVVQQACRQAGRNKTRCAQHNAKAKKHSLSYTAVSNPVQSILIRFSRRVGIGKGQATLILIFTLLEGIEIAIPLLAGHKLVDAILASFREECGTQTKGER
jgi:hypothetical protein